MYPKVNQHILVDLVKKDHSWRSIVAENLEQEILISLPVSNKIGILPNGTELDITFMSGENLYKFSTQIIGKKLDNIPLYRIMKPLEKQIFRIQRRENFRVNYHLKLLLNENEFTTINVSAGGVLFSCSEDIEFLKGEVLSGTIVIPNIQNSGVEEVTFKGQIKRIYSLDSQEIQHVAMEFVEMSEQDQSKIIQLCFDQQRQMRFKKS